MQETNVENLLQRWTDGHLTAAERSQLAQLLEDPSQKDRVINILQRQMMGQESGAVFDELRFLPLLREVLEADRGEEEMEVRPVRRLWTAWRVAAAVLILVVGTVVVVTMRRQVTVPVAVVKDAPAGDAAPGGDKAVLTLADGTRVVLDSAHNGMLADQLGTKVFKTEDGKVRYDAGAHGAAADNMLVTPRGGKYQVTLPDGTQVWLNAASSMRYPTAFTGPERRVKITGEVYFEVAKASARPFVVEVNDLKVEVLGTHFNINAYDDELAVKTSLLEGSVRVARTDKRAVMLRPGQEAQAVEGLIRVVDGIDTAQVMAWKNGLFQFRNADLPSVLRQLARWYDLEVVYEGKEPRDRFDGKIPRDATAAQVLAVLQRNQIHFKIEGKKLIVLP